MSEGPRSFVLNGSPRVDGNTAMAVREFTDALGGTVETVYAYEAGVAPCRGCGGCEGGGCVVRDGMERVWRGLAGADCVVLASPLHFSSLSGPLVSLIGRLQVAWKRRIGGGEGVLGERRRLGALLVTGGAEYGNMFLPARSVAGAAFVSLGVEFVGMAGLSGLDASGGLTERQREEVRALAREVASRCKPEA